MTGAWAYLDHPGPIPFAHRGGAGDHPENTMAAFEHAVRLGYRYLETDVHVTTDNEVVAFHDDVLDRVTDRTGRVADMPWSEVRLARVIRGDGAGDGDQGIPLLTDLLAAWPEARINIDLKHDATVAPLVEVLRRTQAYDRVCVAAFSDRRLTRFRKLTGRQVCTSTGPLEVARMRVAGLTGPIAGACAQVPLRYAGVRIIDPAFLMAAHGRGMPVHVWTIDDETEMDRLLDLGVDGIMTDRPALLRTVLERRGQWA
ncbi:MAG: glycerophosphodiester phosphodiesterase [Acidimicrobiales bacterium]